MSLDLVDILKTANDDVKNISILKDVNLDMEF
jgi:hypothetical protein